MAVEVQNQEPWKEIAVLWSIKGYHVFKIRPHSKIPLLVLPEDCNEFDKNAMKVVMPEQVPDEMLEVVTREGDARRAPQKVKNILGRQVGRVSANLCRVFRGTLEKDMVLYTIMCHYGGHVGHSKFPHVHTAFKRARTRFSRDLGEGGAELKCAYLMRIKDC